MYCSADTDVRPLVLQVTDAIKSDAQVEYFISLADDYINARLAHLYTVPFATTPPVIKQISSHLAAYFTIRSIYAEHRENPNDSWAFQFKEWALQLLKEIEEGLIILIGAGGLVLTASRTGGVTASGYHGTIFDLDDELLWQVPQSYLDGISRE